MDQADIPIYTPRSLERHMQTVLVILATCILIWVGKTVQEMNVKIATMEVKINYLSEVKHPVDLAKLLSIERRIQALETEVATLHERNGNRP